MSLYVLDTDHISLLRYGHVDIIAKLQSTCASRCRELANSISRLRQSYSTQTALWLRGIDAHKNQQTANTLNTSGGGNPDSGWLVRTGVETRVNAGPNTGYAGNTRKRACISLPGNLATNSAHQTLAPPTACVLS